MTRVLVTGANGFVGRALCPALAMAGHNVVAAVRDPGAAQDLAEGDVRAVGSIGPETDWTEALKGVDTVVHLAARVHVMDEHARNADADFMRVNAAGTRRLAESAARAGVRRMVLMSTIKVLGDDTEAGRTFAEADSPAPEDAYGRSKLGAEKALMEIAGTTGLESVIVRPPLVYGPGVGGNMLALLRIVDRALPLPFGAIRNSRSLISVGNLVDAVIRTLESSAAAGSTFVVRDGEDVSTPRLVRMLADALGRPARLLPVPVSLLGLVGHVTGRTAAVSRLTGSLRVDDGLIRRQLDWTPPQTVVQGIADTAAWYAAHRDRNG